MSISSSSIITSKDPSFLAFDNQSTLLYKMKIHGKYMNQTSIDYSIIAVDQNNDYHYINCSISLLVSEPQRLRDGIFKGAIPFIIIIVCVQMGMLLDIEILKELARRPIQIAIGFVCQYGLMPLIAFAITKIFRYSPTYGLGLFVVGTCPGGTQSNQWTVVFDGDLNLSTFMSFASTVASFVMMPLWLYTLGEYGYLRQLKIRIPFGNLAMSLLTSIGPLATGMLIVYIFPKLKALMKRIVKPILIAMIMYFFVFGGFVNFYLIHYVDLRTVLTAPLLPWIGFLAGGAIAWICRQDWKRTMTIGIETGIQNIGIAMMVLLYSLPSPTNTQSTVIPIIVAYLSPQPFYLILLYQLIRRKCCASKKVIDHRVSIDTLSKTTHQLSESEPIVDIPVSLLGTSPESQPLAMK